MKHSLESRLLKSTLHQLHEGVAKYISGNQIEKG